MDIFLWVLQGLLAAVFLAAGAAKAFMPPQRLLADPRMGWITDVGILQARRAGYAEIAGAAGLVLPGLIGTLTWLTPLAALGLVVVQSLAAFTVHRPRNETVVPNVVLGLLSLVVAVGRLVEPLQT